jgi:hypothetical protein
VTNTRTPAPSLEWPSGVWSSGQYRVNVVRDISDGSNLKDRDIYASRVKMRWHFASGCVRKTRGSCRKYKIQLCKGTDDSSDARGGGAAFDHLPGNRPLTHTHKIMFPPSRTIAPVRSRNSMCSIICVIVLPRKMRRASLYAQRKLRCLQFPIKGS